MRGTTIVFDLDGTLVDTAPDLIIAVNHTLTTAGHHAIPTSVLRPAVSLGARRMIEVGLTFHGVAVKASTIDAMTRDLLASYAAHVAVKSVPYPGVGEALTILNAQGATLAICTNKMEGLSRRLMNALSLEHHFKAICGRDTFPVSKPHPGHLLQTIAAVGGRPDRAVMIGDSELDIRTAKAAGVPIIAITHGYSDVPLATFEPDAVIDDFAALPASLARFKSISD